MLRFSASHWIFRRLALPLARHRSGVLIAVAAILGTNVHAGNSLRAGAMASNGKGSSSSAAATSQTATTATDATSQSVAANSVTQQAQASLNHSIQALRALQAAQVSARNAAINGANNLGLNPNIPGQPLPDVTDGLGLGGLNPVGGAVVSGQPSTIQVIKLGASGNTINLASGGRVALPKGTTGTDTVSVTGAGSVTTSGGTVTAKAGSVTTSAGGTLSSLAGGSIIVPGSGSTLSVVTDTQLTSSVAATVTLPGNAGQATLTAGQAFTIPAGSKISFTGTTAGTVTIASSSSASTVTLNGAGTLALANTGATGSGGSITTNLGTVSFSSGVTTSLPAGSTINLTGPGSVTFAGAASDSLPVLLQTVTQNGISATSNYTTTGTLLNTTGYNVPASWVNIGGLSQSVDPTTSHITDTVTQSKQQALLYWNSFNIGKQTTLSFDQSAGGANVGQWVAINEITDPTLRPSQILGSIEAPGQVYVINQNGIIFGGSSQVNVGALTASALALNPDYINNGLLNNAGNNFEFQFSSLLATTTSISVVRGRATTTTTVEPLWTAPPASNDASTVTVSSVATGDVTVQAGAQLSSPTNAENQGGRIALIAPNVTNNGTISTPDGQTILAAGLQVGFVAHNSNDASLRGLDVYVGQTSAGASTLPTGIFTFNGLPNNAPVTFSGSGQVGTYTTTDGAVNAITGGTPVTIPIGSTVNLTSGAPTFTAFQAGTATNAGNTLDAQGAILTPGGDIESPRAEVTITGQTINQLGIINDSTSVALNGRIDLLADYNASAETAAGSARLVPFATGTVDLGGQSVTQILPETSSSQTINGTQLAVSSLVNIQGQSIEMLPGSLLLAPSASAPSSSSSDAFDLIGTALTSGVTLDAGSWSVIGTTAGSQSALFIGNGQIALDAGSSIDVSGSENVSASVAENIIPVQLRGPELANSPLQRDGSLRGTTVYVDIRNAGVYNGTAWIGTPIGDISGYVNNVQRTVGELTTKGGSVALNGSQVNLTSGSTVNVSGGWINYAGANVETTKVSVGGQILDISQATPNLAYSGIYNGFKTTSTKWGVSQSFINSLLSGSQYDAGYVQGGGGGALSIEAPFMTLSGAILGNTVAGAYQRTPQSSLNSTYANATFLPTTLQISGAPTASTLTLAFQQLSGGTVAHQAISDVEIQTDSFISQNTPAADQLLLSQDLVNLDGFSLNVDLSTSGSITVPQGVSLTTVPGGEIAFTAANITIDGSLSAPGGGTTGGLSFTVLDGGLSQGQFNTPAADPTRGHFVLGPDGSLSSTGLIVDDRPTVSSPDTLPLATAGGKISIAALYADLEPGSTIDVSGGASVDASGKVTYGNAGSISILAGRDPDTSSLVTGGLVSGSAPPALILGSTLLGYSGKAGGGGSLTIQSPLVQVGGSSLLNGDNSSATMVQGESSVSSNGTTLWLGSGFFSEGGFGSFNVEGVGQIQTQSSGGVISYVFNAAGDPVVDPAVIIAANTMIDPVVQGSIATFQGNGITLGPMGSTQAAALLPSQRTPVNLTFNAEGITSNFSQDFPPQENSNFNAFSGLLVRGDLVVGAGAVIKTDPQTNSSHGVSLQAANGTIAVLGQIIAPGGTISVQGGSTSNFSANRLLFYETSPDQPFATVDLAPGSLLSTAGTLEQTVNSLGAITGSVLAGGNVVLSGNIEAESGATIDVSGGLAMLAESQASLGRTANQLASLALVPTRIDSNGGSINFNATQLLYSDATLIGHAGGPSAQGGSLTVSSGPSLTSSSGNAPTVPQNIVLIVSQQGFNNGFSLPSGAGTGVAAVNGQAIPGSDSGVGATANAAFGGEPVYSYFAANTNLFSSTATDHATSNNGGVAGGFGSLNLPGTVDFVGRVSITTTNSISVAKSSGLANSGTGGVIYADALVTLTAPYVALNAYETSILPDQLDAYPAALGGTGSLVVNAGTLADVGNLSLQDISTLTFNSNPAQARDIRGQGALQVAGQINLNAAQIYPPTESTFTITADDVAITALQGQPLPSLPLSAGGTLNIVATTIEQGGVLRAPFGIINLGTSATQSVVLSAGSITSVSGVDPTTGKGITIPYGIVNASGTWFDPQGNNITLTGPPTKAINILGQNVQLQSGSTVDVTGGGDLYAYQFVPGTGGNQDILASTGANLSSTSFAIIPGYTLNYAPDGTFAANNNLETDSVSDAGYFNSKLAIGEQIFLNASSGLPSGLYTLLPARYATLPGAYLISPGSGGAPGGSVTQSDGSSLVSGYVANGLNPTMSPVFSSYQIYSQAGVLERAPYVGNLANTYFPANAASNNATTPRLPVDSGLLLLDATQAMTIQGTLLSQAPTGGLGGEVDIASPEDIYIVGPNTTGVPSGALVLDSSQLTSFGAASLLIGGFRTTTATGTSVTVTTSDLVVDNSGATTTIGGVTVDGLAAPDITLVSKANLEIADGAEIEQFGQLSGNASTLTLQGHGALLRVSSDSTAQIVRQNVVPGDTTSVLSIGQGVKILNANGNAAGALILDSTALVSINPSTASAPVLMSKSLTLDSSLINLELGTPATAPTTGLVITDAQFQSLLASTQSLSLLSYSSIAIYGSGQIGGVTVDANGKKTYQETNLALHAGDIYYADTQDSSGVTINAQTVSLDNLSGATILPSLGGLGTGSLTINAQTITLGSNAMRMEQFTDVALNADGAILLKGLGKTVAGSDAAPVAASLSIGGNLTLTTPLITGATTADQAVSATTTSVVDVAINATGSLVIQAPVNDAVTAPSASSLAASLSLSGSSVVQDSGSIVLHSGSLAMQATSEDVVIGGTLDVTGLAPTFYNLIKYTNGGQVSLSSLHGNVTNGSGGLVDVSAASGTGTVDSGAGSAGSLSVVAAGTFTPGQIKANAGVVTSGTTTLAQGTGGVFSLDVGSLNSAGAGDAVLSSLESALTGFTSQSIRDRNDSTVTVDGTVKASSFSLAADKGSIIVAGTIDASHVTKTDSLGNPIDVGGTIDLAAGGSVTLQANGVLTVAANQLDNAGQGGAVTLEAGAYDGTSVSSSTAAINLAGLIDLSVGNGTGGTLHLRAPQVDGGSYVAGSTYTPVAVNASGGGTPVDVAIAPIADGVVKNASSIIVEGFYVQDAQQSSALIDDFEATAQANAFSFTAQASTIQSRIFGSTATNIHIRPGEEIDNSTGSLELSSSWDLSTMRYGAPLLDGQGNPVTDSNGNPIFTEPGILTLRAAGDIDIDFGASLTDGFDTSVDGVSYTDTLLPVGSQSWSYNLTSGADFTGARTGAVQTAAQLQSSGLGGSLQVGYQNTGSPLLLSGTDTNDPNDFFQAIRTGTGNITINAGVDVLLLNNLATIYTAGSQVDPTAGGAFVPPSGFNTASGSSLPATYSSGGGNVSISAQGNIAHETYSSDGNSLVADSSAELPTSWLDREGSTTGTPTTWWIDFTNFFESVGTLGGGDVNLSAGGSVVNVDAAAPTNARLINRSLVELGGGDVVVSAGNNIDGGVYYIERGQGTFVAGNNIQSNATRAAVRERQPSTSADWLATTFFLGKGSLNLTAGGNVLLGSVTNPFLLPQSSNNVASASTVGQTAETSYFTTYALTDTVAVSSLAGSVTIKAAPDGLDEGSLIAWYKNILDATVLNPTTGTELSAAQPWLTLAGSFTTPFNVPTFFGHASALLPGSPDNVYQGVTALFPANLGITAFSGDIDLLGGLTLSPSATGNLNLLAQGSINAFQVNEVDASPFWGSGSINVSDADPGALPSVTAPFTSTIQISNLDVLFTETGVTQGLTLQRKQLLHASNGGASLHATDPNPVHIYAGTGDISGLTLFSPKETQVIAGRDITDIALYLQNNNGGDISMVEAGRDIIAYDASSTLRVEAGTHLLSYNAQFDPLGAGVGAPNAGDIQISGPGTLEVLAGRNLTLGDDAGANPNNTLSGAGIFTGLTSVGGSRNSALPFLDGANILAAAGISTIGSAASGLEPVSLDTFINQFLNPASTAASIYLPDLANAMNIGNASNDDIWAAFQKLSPDTQNTLALDIFYLVLRDAGRDHNNSGSPGFGNFDAATQAIADLFPSTTAFQGNIDVTSREIKTTNSGDIDLLAPGGQVTVGIDLPSAQAVDQGILTVDGGNISIFADGNVNVGTSRIFTLHGGNEIIWSTHGNIAAGASSKTVVSAPPTRVLVDPTSGAVSLDLAGLATGGGIGVLASVAGATPGDVDLIAPVGIVDAGDAGIRASGNLNIAALKVVNADNISVGGKSTGVPAGASVNVGALAAASSAAGSSESAAQNGGANGQKNPADTGAQDLPSIITVEVLGYGGGGDD